MPEDFDPSDGSLEGEHKIDLEGLLDKLHDVISQEMAIIRETELDKRGEPQRVYIRLTSGNYMAAKGRVDMKMGTVTIPAQDYVFGAEGVAIEDVDYSIVREEERYVTSKLDSVVAHLRRDP